MTRTEPDFYHDMSRLNQINESMRALKQEADDIKALYANLPDDKYVAGGFVVSVLRKKRFDRALAKQKLTKAKYDTILVPTPDAMLARRLLDPKDYLKCLKEDAPMFTIKRADEDA